MNSSKSTCELLLEQLKGKNAHVDFEQAVSGLSLEDAGTPANGLPHTIWDLIEHIRISQDDILEFCTNSEYEALDWPDEYWPASHRPKDEEELKASIQAVMQGIEEMRQVVKDNDGNLHKPLDHGDGQTLFREALLIVDHNAYHIGQIVQIRRLLDCW